ncbi:MAG: protein kinase domain-containing protein [Chloroflexota bacterium]
MSAKRIDNYQIGGEAVRTAFGVAFPARDLERRRDVRLTVLNPALQQIPRFEERFLRTARKTGALDASGVCRVAGYGRTGDALYITHEVVEGRPLGAQASRRLPPSVSLALVVRAARVVARIHRQGLAHGVLTPGALLVSRNAMPEGDQRDRWRVTITDLGLPLLTANEMAMASGLAKTVLPFTAPEQAAGGGATPAADLYSLAAILYYLLSGAAPLSPDAFSGDGSRLEAHFTPLLDRRPDLPAGLAELVDKGVALEPSGRFEGAERMARALEAVAPAVSQILSSSEQRQQVESADGPVPAGSEAIGVSVENTSVELHPGETATLQIAVQNRGEAVDHVTVKVEDLPRQWTAISQEFVRLAPGTDTTLALRIQPPRDSSAAAGDHPFRIHVTSTEQQPEPVTIEGRLTVRPFSRVGVEVAPLILEHGSAANVTVKNEGNAPEALTIRGDDAENELRFSSEHERLTVAPGRTKTVSLRISARRQPAFGATQVTPFTVIVAGDGDVREERNGELHIPPAIPRWLAMVMAGLLIVATLAGIIALSPLGEDSGEEAPGAVMVSPTATTAATDEATLEPTPVNATGVTPEAGIAGNVDDAATATSSPTDEPDVASSDNTPMPESEEEASRVASPEPEVTADPTATVSESPTSEAADDPAAADRRLIAYEVVGPLGTSEVRLMTGDGLEDRTLATGARHPVWSPDGRRLALIRSAGEGAGDVLHVFTAGGTDLGPLTDGDERISALAWSPDGAHIAFHAAPLSEREQANQEIFVVASDGASRQQLTATDDGASSTRPVWSPDGGRVLYHQASSEEEAGALYALDFPGGNRQPLVAGRELGITVMDSGHGWSPDGSRVVFSGRDDAGEVRLYIAGADGSGVTPLTESEGDARHVAPVWSPDGEAILYLAAPEAQPWGALLWVAVDGTSSRALASGFLVRSAAWAGDGEQIVISAAPDGDEVWRLYLIELEGGAPQPLVNDDEARTAPAWQP